MRNPKVLELMVTKAKELSGGTMPTDLLAIDAEEETWFKDRLKGRHGVSNIGILRGKPGDEVSMMEKMDALHAAPARTPGTLTEDGY